MFDKTTHITAPSKEYVPYAKTVNVTENKAPTDESIRLYEGMLIKARESLFDSFTLTSPWVGEIQVHVHRDYVNYGKDYSIGYRLQLNDKIISDVLTLSFVDEHYSEKTRDEIIKEVLDGVGSKIVHKIKKDLFKGLITSTEFRHELFTR